MKLQWIPTTKHLPDNSRLVWITIEGDGYWLTKEGYYDVKENLWYEHSGFATLGYTSMGYGVTVTAFCEIPRCPPPYSPRPEDCADCDHDESQHGSESRWFCAVGCDCKEFIKR